MTKELLNRYKIKIRLISIYHSFINEMIKRKHRSLMNVLSKFIEKKIERWFQYFHAILWIDRIIVRDFIDVAFFQFLYEYDAILFIEIEYFTWHMMNWNKIQSIENLLTLRVRQLKRKNENFDEAALHLRRMREQNKELFDDKHQLRKIFLNVNDLMLKHNIKFDNRHDLKLVFRWNELYRIQYANSMKKIYILKEMNEICLERIYVDNKLKRFRAKESEDASTKLMNNQKMIDEIAKNFEETRKMTNVIDEKIIKTENNENAEIEDVVVVVNVEHHVFKNIYIIINVENEVFWNVVKNTIVGNETLENRTKNFNLANPIFRETITNSSSTNLKIRNIYVTINFSIRRSNRLINIENSSNDDDRKIITIVFAIINEISTTEKWNAIEVEEFEIYMNDCNLENFLIALLIFRNQSFAMMIFSKKSTSMNYEKEMNDDEIIMFEKTNINVLAAAFNSLVNFSFNIFLSSTSFFFYMNHI